MNVLPEILIQDLLPVTGFDKEQFIAAHQKEPVTSIRLHPVKGNADYDECEHVPWCSSGRYLPERPVFTTDPLYHAGAYYVQEASSMFLEYMLKELMPGNGGLRVLDLCAAPGGKSTLIASLLKPGDLLVSNEVIRSRASVLEENMTRWGYLNTWVTSNDPKDLGKLQGYFDVIVVDAPCSGSGLFRKDKRALDEWSVANVQLCSERQERILADVWPALKEGGVLIYATCSYSPQEDEEVLDWVAGNMEVERLYVDVNKEWGVTEVESSASKMKGYRFFPDKLQGEGFFISAFRKAGGAGGMKKSVRPIKEDKQATELCSRFLKNDSWVCLPFKDEYIAVHSSHVADVSLLQQFVYLRKVGLRLGTPLKKDWLPAHEIALSIDSALDIARVDVTKEQALKFLKKEEAGLSHLAKGWYIVQYKGLGLGWVKALGNRVNNYLPKHWRIRMDIGDADWA